MINEMVKIGHFMGESFLHIWPYLAITIPLTVAVSMSGASKYIKKAFDAGPITAIFIATAVGAFSPFCSCGVIPIIAALLISGVPLAPVMSFWIASPSMDLEIFFLSAGMIGWNLAIWRLIGTLVLSLGAGFITYFLTQQHWIGTDILRNQNASKAPTVKSLFKFNWGTLKNKIRAFSSLQTIKSLATPVAACCAGSTISLSEIQSSVPIDSGSTVSEHMMDTPGTDTCGCSTNSGFRHRLFKESYSATLMVIKFMALAFFLQALIIFYIPDKWITSTMGQGNAWAIVTAALIGVPAYTSNLSALPMIGGLLTQGMSPAAALAFLIAGPTTTLPAMVAVGSLVSKKVLILYVSFSLLGAILLGYLRLIFG